ncbi:MAG: hypothetical protein COS85_20380 [Armatimonadetes bacterium CG07_land_8_20_14_0_80_59_28]|nr:MAG: hypothetical protein COS85_20380 [Armatimonadetes bacterium CG07_land_8_20_14_0_80_59_28]PIY48339.1 MAG: hypothetical protein COZ05_03445 [Armatimonadetes bacterium CG_4_10_14_3_um_filter_59_10]PJB62229.1 MAG: hypothetical protein CO095_18970 [Armatimonadetes bacterium CG_4_9_14_3_um_filter_58_7]
MVVIAIIAILAAILFPVFARAREKARTASCQSNLKQIALAFHMYAQDFDETYPVAVWYGSSSNWSTNVEPYLRNSQILTCPSAIPSAAPSYGYNGYYRVYYHGKASGGTSTAWGAATLAEVQYPSEIFLAYDAYSFGNSVVRYSRFYAGTTWGYGKTNETLHNGGMNAAFCDGHVKWVSANVVQPTRTYGPGTLPWVGP